MEIELSHLVLIVLLIIYIVFPIRTPDRIAEYVDTIYGIIVVFVVSILLVFHVSPLVGLIGFVAAFELIRRSSGTNAMLSRYLPSQDKRDANMIKYNTPAMPYSVEEEVVYNRMPLLKISGVGDGTYSPVEDKTVHLVSDV